MALGSNGNNGNSSSRGRPYGMMLLLAFGAAVLGVMVLHKLRERHIFTLLIQDKDQHLMNLHLLLQKERESTKEMRRKFEDLKAKYVLVRTEKQAMKSITTSLKQEQRSLESKLEEKQNEINMLRKNEIHSTSENSQIQALKEILKQKEEEIEEMKHLLEKPTTVWSVSTDDPSKAPVLPVVSDKAARSLDDSRNVTGGSELNKIYGAKIHKLEKAEDGEDLGQMDNAGEKNIEKSRSSVSGDEKLMMDNKNKTEVTSIASHRDDT
ncbi:Micronuclear linker histone polyprotein-like protein [Thalictrum thalictroides]|uniref:Micronuclear linker histone polyprotein-like protein n=1 Tax=Thalictrum thalictroides TaxID=46969 RepID=A0A7J6WSB5_THATH|nr:Micronuclear linker histone polyprotein-like protein [Thalictrum thalictroides]